jgi:hypothetical protein
LNSTYGISTAVKAELSAAPTAASASAQRLAAMLPASESGAIAAPPIDEVMPLNRAVEVYERVAGGARARFVLGP